MAKQSKQHRQFGVEWHTSWWLKPTRLKNIYAQVKFDHLPRDRDEHKKLFEITRPCKVDTNERADVRFDAALRIVGNIIVDKQYQCIDDANCQHGHLYKCMPVWYKYHGTNTFYI